MADNAHDQVALTGDDSSTEDYNQIDPTTLDCFPPEAYPVDLFEFKEASGMLVKTYKAGTPLNPDVITRFRQLSQDGFLFFTRNQIEQYAELVSCNLDHALDDPNLDWEEKASIFHKEIGHRQSAFFAHPMRPELERLQQTVEALCLYLTEDTRRMARIGQEIHQNLSRDKQRVNASLMGLAIYIDIHQDGVLTETLEPVSLGFLLYDIGMAKISHLMIAKPSQLSTYEQRALHDHPNKGLKTLRKLNLNSPVFTEPGLQHHERLDGSGYPNRLSGNRISLLGRIAGVADSYAAMITNKSNRKGMPPIQAAAELLKNSKQYDQVVARSLVRFLQTVPS